MPRWRLVASLCLLGALLASCRKGKPAPSLSKSEIAPATVPVPPADGPKLGAIADVAPVFDRPTSDARQIGYLHAGARVTRSRDAVGGSGCPGGWYAIRPRGVVCLDRGATLDMSHPTLLAMALPPKLDDALPYAYARVTRQTSRYARTPGANAVHETEPLPRSSTFAVVGSWSVPDGQGGTLRLGLLTNGEFVRAEDLEAVRPSDFKGVELGDTTKLPLAFVVRRGVQAWKLDGDEAKKTDELHYHDVIELTGRYREVGGAKFWAVSDERYVRHADVTVIQPRHVFPDLATDGQKWIDVSIVTGTLIAYEGKSAKFATLVSVGRDRLGDPASTASTARGTFEVMAKHVTAAGFDAKKMDDRFSVQDLPWALELSSGQMLVAAYWHDRFGVEYGPGAIELSASDARRLWQWATPEVPEGWHGTLSPPDSKKTYVVVRK